MSEAKAPAGLQALSALKSWVAYDSESEFPVQNLPYGVFVHPSDKTRHIGVAIGDQILDLTALAKAGIFSASDSLLKGAVFAENTLNALMGQGKAAWAEARKVIQSLLLVDGDDRVRANAALKAEALIPQAGVQMVLPAKIGDYTDFYASRSHAYNVGVMFRGKENALQPNWTWLPVGYHGRSSSVVVSGTNLRRPCGQKVGPDGNPPSTHGESKQLDYELEMGFFVGPGNKLGEPIDVKDAADNIFGMVLLNDWSARDIQRWEYVPLGPFGGKNFGTSISPWVVTVEALKPFGIAGPTQDPAPLPYLADPTPTVYNIDLQVSLTPKGGSEATVLTRSNAKYLYWTFAQMLAHHSVTGCNMQPGDLLGSGTISGPEEHEFGSMLELSWKGTKSVTLKDGSQRKMIEDGDTVTITGAAQGPGFKIGFGPCTGTILPSHLAK